MSQVCRFPAFAGLGRGALSSTGALLLFVSNVNAQTSTASSSEFALGAEPETAQHAETTPQLETTQHAETTPQVETAQRPTTTPPVETAAPAAVAPERPSQSALYAQFLGPAGMLGVGFSHRPWATLAIDAGVGGFAISLERATLSGAAISVGVSGLFGRGNHSFELGAGGAVLFTHELGESDVVPVVGPHLGYRYQPVGGGWFVRATVHGVVNFRNGSVTPWPGLSLGGTWDS